MKLPAFWSEVRSYPAGVIEEFRRITWPSREKTLQLTLLVIGVVAVFSLIVGGFDLVFSRVIDMLI